MCRQHCAQYSHISLDIRHHHNRTARNRHCYSHALAMRRTVCRKHRSFQTALAASAAQGLEFYGILNMCVCVCVCVDVCVCVHVCVCVCGGVVTYGCFGNIYTAL